MTAELHWLGCWRGFMSKRYPFVLMLMHNIMKLVGAWCGDVEPNEAI